MVASCRNSASPDLPGAGPHTRRPRDVLGTTVGRSRPHESSYEEEVVAEETVSFETVRTHHGIWRWKMERESSQRLVRSWRAVAAAHLHSETKTQLMNVAWSLASFERAYNILIADAHRAEHARAVGVPAIMALLTGPYERSLEYLLTMSLWMDLGDVLAAYRTIVDRFTHLRGSARRQRLSMSPAELEREITILQNRRLPSLSNEPLMILANRILHQAWHPTEDDALALEIHWKGSAEEPVIDFASGDVRGELLSLVEGTSGQVNEFVAAATD